MLFRNLSPSGTSGRLFIKSDPSLGLYKKVLKSAVHHDLSLFQTIRFHCILSSVCPIMEYSIALILFSLNPS